MDEYVYPIGEKLTQAILEHVKKSYGRTSAQVLHYPGVDLLPHDHNRLNVIVGKDETILDIYLG